jgi:hypothetical protein
MHVGGHLLRLFLDKGLGGEGFELELECFRVLEARKEGFVNWE